MKGKKGEKNFGQNHKDVLIRMCPMLCKVIEASSIISTLNVIFFWTGLLMLPLCFLLYYSVSVVLLLVFWSEVGAYPSSTV